VVKSPQGPAVDLPTERLGYMAGTNNTAFTWDPESGHPGPATSSARWVPDMIATLFVQESPREDIARVEARLENETADRALEVKGHIVYKLQGPEGLSEYSSDLLEATLAPGERIKVVFLLELPPGEYSGGSAFRPAVMAGTAGQ
jgi:hypothetical protein